LVTVFILRSLPNEEFGATNQTETLYCHINSFITRGDSTIKNHTHFRSLVTFSLFVLISSVLAFTALTQAGAQEQTTYKVGDRVEVDPQGMDLGPNKTWHKATVTKIGPVGGGVHGFFVTVDAEGDSGPQDVYVRTGANMIRPLQEAEKNDTRPGAAGDQVKKTEPQRDQKTTAATTCPPSDEVKGKRRAIFSRL
jgi:hypothetical protein